jgi:uncharacterized protein (TIGR03083 family)
VVADLAALCDDLLEETRVLESVLEELDDSGWRCSTPAPGWTVHDQVSHLAFFDDAVVSAATAPAAFRDERGPVMADLDAFTATVAERNRAQPPSELLGWFRRSRQGVVAVYSGLDPSMRVPWYGRDMSAPRQRSRRASWKPGPTAKTSPTASGWNDRRRLRCAMSLTSACARCPTASPRAGSRSPTRPSGSN